MRVRIGIVSWNTADLLDHCLASIPAAAEGLDFDVVVVDNHSSDTCVEVSRSHPVITVANEDNVGYARGMNQALLYDDGGPKADVLIALNPDTVAPPGSLTELVRRLDAQPKVGLVVPRLTNVDGSLQHTVYRFPSPLTTAVICLVPTRLQRGRLAHRFWLEGRVPHEVAEDIDWAIGAVHAIRVDALAGALPYCERWFMYVEDMDLCWRMHQAGWGVRLEPSAVVAHVGNASGVQAWGTTRTVRWWEATYDWVRFRCGVPYARRFAGINSLGVGWLLYRARLASKVGRGRSAADRAGRIADYAGILPHHVAMFRAPATAFPPEAAYPEGFRF
ncbi:MAG TPA: glycosyltransferase family 2 protein [Acidimicrobiales bacterium]